MSEAWRAALVLGTSFAVAGGWLRWMAKSPPAPAEADSGAQRPVRETSVPRIGGLAVLAGLLVSGWPLPWWALGSAFLLGAWDDRRPLSPGAKALGQIVPAGLLAWELTRGLPGTEIYLQSLWIVPLAWAAQNIVNTWDHADGLVCGLGGLALPPVAAAAFLGVLPWNLLLRKPSPGQGQHDLPRLYLGDAGAHVAAILLVSFPLSRWFLILPALDLARVVWLRWRAGHRIWVGDRRHLGHRLQNLGWPPKLVAVAALAPAAPLLGAAGWGIFAALSCATLWGCLVWASQPMQRS